MCRRLRERCRDRCCEHGAGFRFPTRKIESEDCWGEVREAVWTEFDRDNGCGPPRRHFSAGCPWRWTLAAPRSSTPIPATTPRPRSVRGGTGELDRAPTILGQPDQCGHGPTSRPPGRDRRCGPARDRSRRGRHARRGGGEGTGTRQHQVCHRLLETRDLLRSMRPAGYERRPYRMAFEPLRGRRDLTARGRGPLPIHECPCDIGTVVHEKPRSDVAHWRLSQVAGAVAFVPQPRGRP